jgi:hypothetical protein
MPWFATIRQKRENPAENVRVAATLLNAGVPLKVAEIMEKTGFTPPKKNPETGEWEEDVIEGRPAPSALPPGLPGLGAAWDGGPMVATNANSWTWIVAQILGFGDATFQVPSGLLAAPKLPDEFSARQFTKMVPKPMAAWVGHVFRTTGDEIRLRASAVVVWAPVTPEAVRAVMEEWEPKLVQPATEADAAERYLNRRAELWWALRDWIVSEVTLADCPSRIKQELRQDLPALKYSHQSDGRRSFRCRRT